MNKYRNKSKGRQVFATQQMPNAPHPEPVAAAVLTHKDIAKRAHEIYVEKGYQQGQSEQNWLQAEQELKNQQNGLQAGRDTKNQDQAGHPAAYGTVRAVAGLARWGYSRNWGYTPSGFLGLLSVLLLVLLLAGYIPRSSFGAADPGLGYISFQTNH